MHPPTPVYFIKSTFLSFPEVLKAFLHSTKLGSKLLPLFKKSQNCVGPRFFNLPTINVR